MQKITAKLTLAAACIVLMFVSVFSSHGTAKATQTQEQVCTWDNLIVTPNPAWNTADSFTVTNKATYPMTYTWVLDMWNNTDQDQDGTTTLQPGESKSYGFGYMCPKWQFDVTCGGKQWGAVVESNESACNESTTPTPVPTVTITVTPTPIVESTPVPTPTVEITTDTESTPSATPTQTPTPTQQSTSGNSSDSGSNNSGTSNNSNTSSQSSSGSNSQQSSGGQILAATTMADTGIVEDVIAYFPAIIGMVFVLSGGIILKKAY